MRKHSRVVRVGNLSLGGGNPIAVQSMWDKPFTENLEEERKALFDLAERGCDILRFAVPDQEAAEQLGRLAQTSPIPLVADIHFDYRLALKVMDYPVAKIRINPGNIGASWKVKEVIKKAMSTETPLRVGANEGSLPKHLRGHKSREEAMVLAAEEQIELLEKEGYSQVVVSLKSSSVDRTIQANRIFTQRHDYPLHLGVTEAGPLIPSLVKSTLALGTLLKEGIGDTLRISISDSPSKEIQAARELLAQLHMDSRPHVNIISCPKCGRTSFDTHRFAQEVEGDIQRLNKEISVAIMGCEVNGPGEARQADIGITGSGDKVVIFKKGKIIRREALCDARKAFLEELEKL